MLLAVRDVQAVQIAVTAAVAEAAAPPPPPPPPPERIRELEDRILALTAELKVANDKCAFGVSSCYASSCRKASCLQSIVYHDLM